MNQCPNCGKYMTFSLRYSAGYPFVEYNCSCGYSTNNECCTTDNKTYMHKEIVSVSQNTNLKR